MRSGRGKRVQLPPLLIVVLLSLAQVATRGVREKEKKREKKTRRFPREGKESDKSEKIEENQQPSKGFTILNQDDQFKWVLMAKYYNSHFNHYVQKRDLPESILTENPVPSNITGVKKLGEVMSHLLKENNRTSYVP